MEFVGHRTSAEFAAQMAGEKAVEKAAPWKPMESAFPLALGNPAKRARFPLSHSSGAGELSTTKQFQDTKAI